MTRNDLYVGRWYIRAVLRQNYVSLELGLMRASRWAVRAVKGFNSWRELRFQFSTSFTLAQAVSQMEYGEVQSSERSTSGGDERIQRGEDYMKHLMY